MAPNRTSPGRCSQPTENVGQLLVPLPLLPVELRVALGHTRRGAHRPSCARSCEDEGADGPPGSAAARSCSQLNGVSPLGTQAADRSEDHESLPLNKLPSFCERCRSRQDSSLESPLLVFNVNLTGNLRSLWI